MKHYVYNSPFKMVDKKGTEYKLVIEQDYCDDYNDPLHYEEVAHMYCWHPQYELGHKHIYPTFKDFQVEAEQFIGDDKIQIVPLWLYDHSGISLSTKQEWPYNDRWDSMFVGCVWISKKVALEFIGGTTEENWRHKCLEYAENIVKEYNSYLCGEVYEYILYKEMLICVTDRSTGDVVREYTDWHEIDGCGGYTGNCLEDNGILEEIAHYGLTFVE